LIGGIIDILTELSHLKSSSRKKDINLEKEEVHILQGLENHVEHREWKAVKKDVKVEF